MKGSFRGASAALRSPNRSPVHKTQGSQDALFDDFLNTLSRSSPYASHSASPKKERSPAGSPKKGRFSPDVDVREVPSGSSDSDESPPKAKVMDTSKLTFHQPGKTRKSFQLSTETPDTALDAWRLGLQGRLPSQRRVRRLVESNTFGLFIGSVIVANSIVVCVETERSAQKGELQQNIPLNVSISMVFLVELLLRLYAYGLLFFRGAFNWFDFVLVVVSVVDDIAFGLFGEVIYGSAQTADTQGGPKLRAFSVLRVVRLIRVVRVLRVLKLFRQLQLLVKGLIKGITALFWVMLLLCLFIFICAVFTTQMYGIERPENEVDEIDWQGGDEDSSYIVSRFYFGGVGESAYSLFQIMTLEAWASSMARPMERAYPRAWIFFVVYICFTTLAILNLVTGIFVEQTMLVAREEADFHHFQHLQIVRELHQLFVEADKNQDGTVTREELLELVEEDEVADRLCNIGLTQKQLDACFDLVDENNDGIVNIDEFVKGVLSLKADATKFDLQRVNAVTSRIHRQLHGTSTSNALAQVQLERMAKRVRYQDARISHLEIMISEIYRDVLGRNPPPPPDIPPLSHDTSPRRADDTNPHEQTQSAPLHLVREIGPGQDVLRNEDSRDEGGISRTTLPNEVVEGEE
ncbi:unnamed protein product [Vitrella brassicaformis CCMP3155]|uniref:EF-hand domain-containing protein n=1 Tax=Vitrella brassicaformis (strain CCMP3155) TaxID=1169540 RepID=A0A0G4ENY3_VITBC|nr:unnamed protein product [Vitrella brassicaformis CCMP3155]|eukprot:CEL99129.1 unnamed protein product [Vitrella brassicaformis CCMP3155]